MPKLTDGAAGCYRGWTSILRSPTGARERGGAQADGQRAGGFNTQSLIEAPRKRAFFHNNAFVTDVESAAAFYFTPTFDGSQGASGRVAQIRYCAKPGNVCPNSPSRRLAGSDALAALGGTEALNKLGFFLRALSVVYSLADCERLVEEMMERSALGLPTSLPAMHCQFALKDVQDVLEHAKVPLPPQYQQLVGEVPALETALASATVDGAQAASAGTDTQDSIRSMFADLQRLRRSIATSPQLPVQRPTPAPAIGLAAAAGLVLMLFGFALFRLRRS